MTINKNLNGNALTMQIVGRLETTTAPELEEAIDTSRRLAREEGLVCGISSGTNVAAALKLARKLGPGKTVVTVLPDTAERYYSTQLFGE